MLTPPRLRTLHHLHVEPVKPWRPWLVGCHELACRAWGSSLTKMSPITLAEVVHIGHDAHSVQHRSRHLGDAN